MFGSPLGVLVWLGVAVLVMTSAELARSAYARLTGMQIRRNRLAMLAPSSQDSLGKRIGAIAIGPVGAYLAISLIALTLYRCNGIPSETVQLVGDVSPGFPADGVVAEGDRIVEVEGQPLLGGSRQIHEVIERHPEAPVTLVVERDGQRRTERLIPKLVTDRGEPRYLLGIIFKPDLETPGIGTAVGLALAYPYRQERVIVGGLLDVFTGKEDADPSGPARIAAEMRTAYEHGPATVVRLGMLLGAYCLLALIGFDLVRMIILLVRR